MARRLMDGRRISGFAGSIDMDGRLGPVVSHVAAAGFAVSLNDPIRNRGGPVDDRLNDIDGRRPVRPIVRDEAAAPGRLGRERGTTYGKVRAARQR